MSRVVVDTGPLVALLNRRDRHHDWVRQVLDTVEPPVFTCEAVISEACFLLSRIRNGQDAVFELLSKEILKVDFRLTSEVDAVRALMRKLERSDVLCGRLPRAYERARDE
jgi:predicted nucleic acid-binding protein